jgi:hypothetical protein
MDLRACRAPDHKNSAGTLSSVVARRGARIPKFFPSALSCGDEGDPLDSKEATFRPPRLTIGETSRLPHIFNVARHRLLPV